MIPKAFVIAPHEFKDRRMAAKTHLEALGIDYTLFSGIHGESTGFNSSRAKSDHVYFKLTPNRIALAINHWVLWQHIVMAEIPRAIIFEDDVILPPDFTTFFEESLASTPTDWDMIYMAILYPERLTDGRIIVDKVAGNVWRHLGARTWDGGVDGMHAYMLTLAGARKMTSASFNLDETIDRWTSANLLQLLNVYIWHPSEIKQKSGEGQWATTQT